MNVGRYMVNIIRDEKLIRIANSIKPDAKRRVHLPKVLIREDVTYNVYTNSAGQIVLDPQITIPASEAWLFEDKTALASVDKGMADSVNGRIIDRGSFAKYTKNEP
jgi:hypothetical protein